MSVWDPFPLVTYVVVTPYALVTVVDCSAWSVFRPGNCSRSSSS